jgi:hypothetical protein
MPKKHKDEEQKRRETEAAAMKLALSEERQDQLKKKTAEFAMTPKKHVKEKSKIGFKCSSATLSLAHKEDWMKIVADFEKLFHHGLEKDGIMLFSSMEEAQKFFKGQAENEKRRFFVTESENDKLLDHHFYSCGDGQLYEGT